MPFRPLYDQILVRPDKADEVTSGGIIIPDAAQDKPQKGEIVAVGNGARDAKTGEIIASFVQVGERIMYGKWSGTEIEVDGEKVLIMKEADVMGIIEE